MKISAKIRLILSFVSIVIFTTSCFKKENYPIEPIIEFDSFTQSGNTANLTFNFTDGDGDLGLSDSDTLAPYNVSSEFYYNLYIYYFEKDDVLGWVNGKDLENNNVVLKYRMKPIATKGKSKGFKGKFNVDLGENYYNFTSSQSDTIKYKIQLIDRALHKSNLIESNEIIR